MNKWLLDNESFDRIIQDHDTTRTFAYKIAKAQVRLSVRGLARIATVTTDVATIPREVWNSFVESAWE